MILKNLFSFSLRWMHLDPQIVICQVGLDLEPKSIIIGASARESVSDSPHQRSFKGKY